MNQARLRDFGQDALAVLIRELERMREAFEMQDEAVGADYERKTK